MREGACDEDDGVTAGAAAAEPPEDDAAEPSPDEAWTPFEPAPCPLAGASSPDEALGSVLAEASVVDVSAGAVVAAEGSGAVADGSATDVSAGAAAGADASVEVVSAVDDWSSRPATSLPAPAVRAAPAKKIVVSARPTARRRGVPSRGRARGSLASTAGSRGGSWVSSGSGFARRSRCSDETT